MRSYRSSIKKTLDIFKCRFNLYKYAKIRNNAWAFLIRNNVTTLPLDVENIAIRNSWILIDQEQNTELVDRIDKQRHNKELDGFTCIYKSRIFIIYKQLQNKGRQLFTIAHEFGHIELYHLDKLTTIEYEREANMFAARILMPLCVLKECNALTATRISSICGTSLQSSQYRADRLNLLINRNKFYTSKYEILVLKLFKKFISNKIGENTWRL